MAIYHLSAQIISRSSGRSSVAAAAYRCGARMVDERTGQVCDYTRKPVDGWTVLAPDNAPDWTHDPAQLWNAAERAETRSNSQVAREINVALPGELAAEQREALMLDYVRSQFVERGMCALVAFHGAKSENPHAHIMLGTRAIGPDGFGQKRRDWNDRELLGEWRKQWAEHANQALEQAGHAARIDHRSLEAQGVDRPATIHLGPWGGGHDRREHNEQARAWVREHAARLAEQRAADARLKAEIAAQVAALARIDAARAAASAARMVEQSQSVAAARRERRAAGHRADAHAWRGTHQVRAWLGFDGPARRAERQAQEATQAAEHAARRAERVRAVAERAEQEQSAAAMEHHRATLASVEARGAAERAAETPEQREARRAAASERWAEAARERAAGKRPARTFAERVREHGQQAQAGPESKARRGPSLGR